MTDPNRFLRGLLVANDATQAMQTAVERVREIFECDVSWTGVLHDDRLQMGAYSGLSTSEMAAAWRLDVGAGIGGRSAQLGRPHKSNDYQHDARRVPAKRLIDNEGIVTVLVVPILAADRTLGVLYAASRSARKWAEAEVEELESISHFLAVRLKQLDVDGRSEAEALTQRRRADEAVAALRAASELVNSLTHGQQVESALEATATAARARIELRDEQGLLLHAAGPRSSDAQRTLLSGELEGGSGLVVSLLSADPQHSTGAPAVRLIYDALRLQLLRLSERDRTTEDLRGELLDQLLTGRIVDAQSLTRRLSAIGMADLTRGARALVIGTNDQEQGISTRLIDDLRSTFSRCLVEHRDERLVVLFAPQSTPPDEIEHRLSDLLGRERLRRGDAAGPVIIGIGRASTELIDISMSYDEARAACEVGLGGDRRTEDDVLSARSLGIQGLASLPLTQLRTTVADTFGPLLDSDRQRGTQHLATVRSYLANDRHIPATARDLRVHYNTVRNRIARIEALLGVDLDDVDGRFRVETALRMEAVVRALSRRTSYPVTP